MTAVVFDKNCDPLLEWFGPRSDFELPKPTQRLMDTPSEAFAAFVRSILPGGERCLGQPWHYKRGKWLRADFLWSDGVILHSRDTPLVEEYVRMHLLGHRTVAAVRFQRSE